MNNYVIVFGLGFVLGVGTLMALLGSVAILFQEKTEVCTPP